MVVETLAAADSRRDKMITKGDDSMNSRVCLAGAAGWAGSALSRGVFEATDMDLVAAISRSHAGRTLGEVLDIKGLDTPIFATATEGLATSPDVFVEYTKPEIAKFNVLSALRSGAHVVIGTSGLSEKDYLEIDEAAREVRRGVLAVGNFALTVVLLQKFSEIAARYIPHWEIIDYAHSTKIDAPSGTARELAHRLSKVRESLLDVALEKVHGLKESRGVRLEGSQIHSVRLPGYVIAVDTIFGMPDQKLVLRHEAGSSAIPYVDGALLAIRKVGELIGVHRGLDSVMDF
ncbi:MAG: 4-hydroxy-tetrahydrodipicolinate reductase [Desulfobacterales bacterium]